MAQAPSLLAPPNDPHRGCWDDSTSPRRQRVRMLDRPRRQCAASGHCSHSLDPSNESRPLSIASHRPTWPDEGSFVETPPNAATGRVHTSRPPNPASIVDQSCPPCYGTWSSRGQAPHVNRGAANPHERHVTWKDGDERVRDGDRITNEPTRQD